MKWLQVLLLDVLVSLSANVEAGVSKKPSLPKVFSKNICRTQVVEKIEQWFPNPIWIRELLPLEGVHTFRASGGEVGTWLELRGNIKDEIELRRITPDQLESIHWNSPAPCKGTSEIIGHKADSLKLLDAFTDSKLKAWMHSHPRGIVYAWSPSMPFSVDGMEVIKNVASALHMDLKIVLDPHADVATAKAVYTRSPAWPAWLDPMERMESVELFQRGMGSHYPSILVIAGGKIRGMAVPGVKRFSVYEKMIRQRLSMR